MRFYVLAFYDMPLVTVFTSTYNRAYSLPRLYESLIHQTYTDFEWLVIDDGSIDDTKRLVQQWAQEQKITIRYYYQTNGGKHGVNSSQHSVASEHRTGKKGNQQV